MKWRVTYEWGEKPGEYDRIANYDVEGDDIHAALKASDMNRPINSRVRSVSKLGAESAEADEEGGEA